MKFDVREKMMFGGTLAGIFGALLAMFGLLIDVGFHELGAQETRFERHLTVFYMVGLMISYTGGATAFVGLVWTMIREMRDIRNRR